MPPPKPPHLRAPQAGHLLLQRDVLLLQLAVVAEHSRFPVLHVLELGLEPGPFRLRPGLVPADFGVFLQHAVPLVRDPLQLVPQLFRFTLELQDLQVQGGLHRGRLVEQGILLLDATFVGDLLCLLEFLQRL